MTDLTNLQNLARRDPESYREEVLLQLSHYEALLKVFQLKPSKDSKRFQELIRFLSHVSSSFPEQLSAVPSQLCSLLEENATILQSDLRIALAKALSLFCTRGLLDNLTLLPLFFRLFRVPDKELRALMYATVVKVIRTANAKQQNNKLNRTMQNYVYSMLKDSSEIAAGKSLEVMIELYRRRVWNDSKTVNVIVSACFSEHSRVITRAVRFFIMSDTGGLTEETDAEEFAQQTAAAVSFLKDSQRKKNQHSKQSKQKKRKLEMKISETQRKLERARAAVEEAEPNWPALYLINDPQSVAEKLLSVLRRASQRFEQRLMIMNLISRLISCHELILLDFYPFLMRYLRPSQERVTSILAIAAQSCHPLVDPFVIRDLLKTIIDKFIQDRAEVVTVGLNAVREICRRQPHAMEEAMLHDLVQYTSHCDKGVTFAARSLINLYREVNPALLRKKDRGKKASLQMRDDPVGSSLPAYGERRVASSVPAAALLASNSSSEASDGEGGEEEQEDDSSSGSADSSKPLDQTRFLTAEDFDRIAEKREELLAVPENVRKRVRIELPAHERTTLDDVVKVEEIEEIVKKKARATKEERIASVLKGREGREKFGSRKGKKELGSTTNQKKNKRKNTILTKFSRAVQKRFRETSKQKKARQQRGRVKRGNRR